jgi:DNA helicase II / ATP-dependent DNA helicase PcrA
MQSYLGKLNPNQQAAAKHKDGPLLVLAGAGSGKTTTMATRIAYLIAKHNILAENILGLSFTRKAADELRERVVKMVSKTSGPRASRGITLSTFHALCVKVLRAYASEIGFSNTFTIFDEADKTELLKSLLKNINLDDRRFDVDVIMAEISFAKNRFLSPNEAREFFLTNRKLPEDYAIIIANVYEHYQSRLKTLNSLDFDDLLFQAVHLLETSEKASNHFNAKFRYILVDEYQDTNPAQFRLLSALTKNRLNLCVVGDDDQSIYSWRGADAAHILEFKKHFPDAEIITLNQNYRSKQIILDAANSVIEKNTVRHPKKLWSDRGEGELIKEFISEEDRGEAQMVAEEIEALAKNPDQPRVWKDFAILFRSNPQSRLFEEALRLRKIPYKIVGALSYLERKEVRDALSFLKLISNPKDDASFRRVVNYPARGLGKTTLDHLNSIAMSTNVSLFHAAQNSAGVSTLSPKAREALAGFTTYLSEKRKEFARLTPELPILCDWGKRFFRELRIKEAIFDETEDPKIAERKWENVEELMNALGQMNLPDLGLDVIVDDGAPTEKSVLEESLTNPALADALLASLGDAPDEDLNEYALDGSPAQKILTEFLSMMTLDPKDDKDDEKDEPKNEVTLLTLHGSKGLEYPIVFLVGMEDGYLPHQRTLDEGSDLSEERRLAYVGITRAKDLLFLTRARTRIRYGKPILRVPSRYLQDIPKHFLQTQNHSHAPVDPNSKVEQEEHEVRVKDFMSRLRAQITTPK